MKKVVRILTLTLILVLSMLVSPCNKEEQDSSFGQLTPSVTVGSKASTDNTSNTSIETNQSVATESTDEENKDDLNTIIGNTHKA